MERELAINVITRAVRDLIEERDTKECLSFLLGHTEMSEFWFGAAGMSYFRPKDFRDDLFIKKIMDLNSKLATKIKRKRDGRLLDKDKH